VSSFIMYLCTVIFNSRRLGSHHQLSSPSLLLNLIKILFIYSMKKKKIILYYYTRIYW
jgi:hypothetical protein